jgi:mannose-6-phosphate isomerase-like protein (cupin superfamily)
MNDLLDALRRDDKDMPADFVQWQLPVHLDGPALFFLTVVPPGGIVTMHAHDRDMFRVVVSGSIILHDGRELKSGDWMFVPNDEEYSFRAGLNPGAIIYHCYG